MEAAKYLTDNELGFVRKILGLSKKGAAGNPYFSTITNLLTSIKLFNGSTFDHSFRVAYLCGGIADALTTKASEKKPIMLGALLHDIGIIGTKNLFSHDKCWSKIEEREYRKHTAYGERIVRPIDSLANMIPFIGKHHEYINGLGYPNALKSPDLSQEVQILTIANDFDMMSNKFPWTQSYSYDKILKIIDERSSSYYAKNIVEAFSQFIRSEGKKIS